MKNIKYILSVAAFALAIIGLPAIASAQYGGYGGNGGYGGYGGYGGNGGYGNNGYYNNAYGAIRDLKDRSRDFERNVNRNKDSYGYYSTKDFQRLVKDFRKAADKLEDKSDRGRDLNRSRNEAVNVVNYGSLINRELRGNRNIGYMMNDWYAIENDLRVIANTYGINYNNGRNGTWGNGRGNGRVNLPSWWPF